MPVSGKIRNRKETQVLIITYNIFLYFLIPIKMSKDNWQDKPEINSNDREVSDTNESLSYSGEILFQLPSGFAVSF